MNTRKHKELTEKLRNPSTKKSVGGIEIPRTVKQEKNAQAKIIEVDYSGAEEKIEEAWHDSVPKLMQDLSRESNFKPEPGMPGFTSF